MSLLITQCLQRDFVAPLGEREPLPNLLHVGFEESRRLLGEEPSEGPVARMISWARQQSAVDLIHLRDWHDSESEEQRAHIERFGRHCLAGTDGAEFVFSAPSEDSDETIVDSLTLNDFHHTGFEQALQEHVTEKIRVGLVGVWTEAKIFFLAYELCTRFPAWQIAVCSALTASNSRANHFHALDQMRMLFGIRIIDSVSEFMEFLSGKYQIIPLPGMRETEPRIRIDKSDSLSPEDTTLLRYLFRDCSEISVSTLAGGFSGNQVFAVTSIDHNGHEQVPHVVKLGPRALMGKERTTFERIEPVLGNSAPRISDFADYGERGGIKYRYASMGRGESTTFQKLYSSGAPLDECADILTAVFEDRLGRFSAAATREKCSLLEYYGFDSKWAPQVREAVTAISGVEEKGKEVLLADGTLCRNIADFYECSLPTLAELPAGEYYQAYCHGDLNGANIILDSNRNVWLIDFFHCHRGHILIDLIKFENDLLYIFTPLGNSTELAEARIITDVLLNQKGLAEPLPDVEELGLSYPQLIRCYETVKVLRGFYPRLLREVTDPWQAWVGQLRYAVHTLSFTEPSDLQKQWALYAASCCIRKIETRRP